MVVCEYWLLCLCNKEWLLSIEVQWKSNAIDNFKLALIKEMVDAHTKQVLAGIPLLKTNAGPRDGDQWTARLKEELISLIQVILCPVAKC